MVQQNNFAVLILTLVLIVACGPDTVFLRPALDTPAQHVKNGHNLLVRGKIDAAKAEFMRAKSLDDGYAPAYVGLALIQGHRGDIDAGVETLNQAKGLISTPEDATAVHQGYELLKEMQSGARN